MKYLVSALLGFLLVASSTIVFAEADKHLFILSGQSNMARLDPEISFTPLVEARFGKDNVIVVKNDKSGRPIRRWYKDWESNDGSVLNFRGPFMDVLGENSRLVLRAIEQLFSGEPIQLNGMYYEELMADVNKAIGNDKLESITFVWMHGERDAREGYGDVYEASLEGLINQFKVDFSRDDVNFVIGRISDWDNTNTYYPDWTLVREVQVNYADTHERTAWVDTDDLNSGYSDMDDMVYDNDIHYSMEGYRVFGERLANAAIMLIESNK